MKHAKIAPKLKLRDGLMVTGGIVVTLLVILLLHVLAAARTPLAYQSSGVTIGWIPGTVRHWDTPINQMARKYDVDPNLIAIIMTLESGGDATAKSEDDAEGLMQITPLTAKDISTKYLKDPTTNYNLMDPQQNIEFGAAYLAYLRDYFGTASQGPDWTSTVELVAAGYNGGPGAAGKLDAGKGLTDTQTVVYSRDAFNMWRERNTSDSPTFDRWKERGGSDLLDAAKTSQE